MAFSHVRKAFPSIRRDLSKHTTDFIQEVQVHCVKTYVARKLSYQKYKNTRTFSNGSRIHEIWTFRKVNWRLYYRATKQIYKSLEDERCEVTQWISERKTRPKKSTRDRIERISLRIYNLSLVCSEKTAKTLNLQVLEVCFQVLIDIWKNANFKPWFNL